MSVDFWFVDPEDNQRGPVAKAEIVRLIRHGTIGRDSQLWAAGMSDWAPAGQIEDFVPLFTPSASRPSRLAPKTENMRVDDGNASGHAAKVSFTQRPRTAQTVYGLYLMSWTFSGIPAAVGVISAYICRNRAPEWLRSHYRFQIRTFWIGICLALPGKFFLLFGIRMSDDDSGIGFPFIVAGGVVLVFWALWGLVRCIKGLRLVRRGEAYPNPAAWMF
jgi:uncharacterized membrane protein